MSTNAPTPPKPLQKPNENHTPWLLRRVWDRVNRDNEHFMGCVVGREGSGKSYTAIKIANTIDESFSAERVIFDVTELLEVLKNEEHDPGNFYVLDEAGVQLGVRTWQDRAQILANQALQLVRNHNLGLIFTLPRLSELDSQAEGRLQAVLEMQDKEPGEYVTLKWKWLDPDRVDRNGNILKKYPRRRQGGFKKRITRNTFSPPDSEIVEEYETQKRAFQDQFYEKTIEKLRGEDGAEAEDDGPSVKEVAEQVEEDGIATVVSVHSGNGTRYIDKDYIRAEYELSHSDAKAVKSLLERRNDLSEVET